MKPSGVVTLLTDFGEREPFVGVMKGVMVDLAPSLRFIDLTHCVPPFDIGWAAFWLANAAPWFPKGTTHLAVVDPGVGTERRVLVAECQNQWFVAPDNGILTDVLSLGPHRVFAVPVQTGVSATFHGRDVFAPVAAKLAGGLATPDQLGSPALGIAALEREAPAVVGDVMRGHVVVVDHFGNLISNLRLPRQMGTTGWVQVGPADGRGPSRRVRLVRNYASTGKEAAAVVNAWGLIEIAVNRGNASEALGLGVGDRVWLELR